MFDSMDGWMKWGFTSFIFAQDRLIRTARDQSNEVKGTHETAVQHRPGPGFEPGSIDWKLSTLPLS